jgi:very-short-patch-repair endonuclease
MIIDSSIEELNFLAEKYGLKSTKNILKYNKPEKTSILLEMVKRSIELKSGMTEEKFIIMYGKTAGAERYRKKSSNCGITLERMIEKHGLEIGTKKFNAYREIQAYTNSLEYKSKKYGMTEEEFNHYNKSRAVTLDNMTTKYGLEIGTEKFNAYREIQAYTNSAEYLGEDRYKLVNKQKGCTLDAYIVRHGEIEGTKKFIDRIQKSSVPYSKISQKLFTELSKYGIMGNKQYYATNGGEYGILCKDKKYIKLDYVSLDNKLCIEFQGDHYHGNPNIYSPDQYLRGKGMTKTTAAEAWEKDKMRELIIKEMRGFDTICVWELDYKTDPQGTIERILNYVKCNNRV